MVLSFLLIVYPLVQWLLNWNDIPEELLQEELKHMQNGDPADIVYLCFQEAFNKVSYQFFFFLRKLSRYGIRKKVMAWRCV